MAAQERRREETVRRAEQEEWQRKREQGATRCRRPEKAASLGEVQK